MTFTLSATDRDLVADMVGLTYDPLLPQQQGGATYSVSSHVSFDLRLERSEAGWTIADRQTGVHGFGETPIDALVDFRTAAHEHVDTLERQDRLSEDLREQLDYLRSRLSA